MLAENEESSAAFINNLYALSSDRSSKVKEILLQCVQDWLEYAAARPFVSERKTFRAKLLPGFDSKFLLHFNLTLLLLFISL